MFLDGSIDSSVRPFLKHFEDLKKEFENGNILTINLVRGKKDENEVMLKERYEDMIARCNLDYLSYKFFDFHNECHENSQPLIDLVEKDIFPN